MKKNRYVIVGLGKYGEKRLNSLNKNLKSSELVGVFDTNLDQKFKGLSSDMKIYSSLKEVFNDSNVDSIILSTPNNTHFDICKETLLHGKNILCEKPLGISSEEIFKLKTLVLENPQLTLKMGSNLSYFPALIKLKKLLESKKIGELIEVKSSIGHNGAYVKDSWHTSRNVSGGGSLIDNGVHLITYFNSLFDELQLIESNLIKEDFEVESVAQLQLSSTQCPSIKIESSWKKTNGYCEIEVKGTLGSLKVNVLNDEVLFLNDGRSSSITCDEDLPSIDNELINFSEAIIEKKAIYPNISDSQNILNIIFKAYSSFEN